MKWPKLIKKDTRNPADGIPGINPNLNPEPGYNPQPDFKPQQAYNQQAGPDARSNNDKKRFPILVNLPGTHAPRQTFPNPPVNIPPSPFPDEQQPPPGYTHAEDQNVETQGHPHSHPTTLPLMHNHRPAIPVPALAAGTAAKLGGGGFSKSIFSKLGPKPKASRDEAAPAAERTPVRVTGADVRRCVTQLRLLYKLRLELWITEDDMEDNEQEIFDLQTQSEIIQHEIETTIAAWKSAAAADWTDEERQQVEYCATMCAFVSDRLRRKEI